MRRAVVGRTHATPAPPPPSPRPRLAGTSLGYIAPNKGKDSKDAAAGDKQQQQQQDSKGGGGGAPMLTPAPA